LLERAEQEAAEGVVWAQKYFAKKN
jgi:hypothetical protein